MTKSVFDLTGKVALVTGGSDGIGRAIADLLATRGADLGIAARRQDQLDRAATQIASTSGKQVAAIAADVTVPDQVTQLIASVIERFGRLDILVNNAGGAQYSPLRKAAPEAWRRDLELNLSSAFYCSQAAFAHLAQSNGCIVNISSIAGSNGTMGTIGYSSAKAGLQMLTKTAAAEWGPKGVRVNAVAAGMIATRKARKAWEASGFDGDSAATVFPLRRCGKPEEVAEAVAFLASDAASYITGERLGVSGGPQMKGLVDVD